MRAKKARKYRYNYLILQLFALRPASSFFRPISWRRSVPSPHLSAPFTPETNSMAQVGSQMAQVCFFAAHLRHCSAHKPHSWRRSRTFFPTCAIPSLTGTISPPTCAIRLSPDPAGTLLQSIWLLIGANLRRERSPKLFFAFSRKRIIALRNHSGLVFGAVFS